MKFDFIKNLFSKKKDAQSGHQEIEIQNLNQNANNDSEQQDNSYLNQVADPAHQENSPFVPPPSIGNKNDKNSFQTNNFEESSKHPFAEENSEHEDSVESSQNNYTHGSGYSDEYKQKLAEMISYGHLPFSTVSEDENKESKESNSSSRYDNESLRKLVNKSILDSNNNDQSTNTTTDEENAQYSSGKGYSDSYKEKLLKHFGGRGSSSRRGASSRPRANAAESNPDIDRLNQMQANTNDPLKCNPKI